MRRDAARLLALAWAGESIYLLPFTLRRDYSDALIEGLDLSGQAELGALYSLFGVLCLLAYPAGGWIADLLPARTLLVGSLLATALGGGLLFTLPTSPAVQLGLFAFWALTTIATFWSALIKATRVLGGDDGQGRVFGLLAFGRGLLAAAVASGGLFAFRALGGGLPGLRAVIALYGAACLLGAVFVLLALPTVDAPQAASAPRPKLRDALVRPRVWLLGVIVLAAYSAYYGTFYLAGFAAAAHGQSEADAAAVSVFSVWLRPVAPLAAGLLADRFTGRRVAVGAFFLLAATFASLGLGPASSLGALYLQSALIAVGAFALRGVYHALLAEGGLPLALTGTAVGVVSVIGYLPDVLTPYTFGAILDAQPGPEGFRTVFGVLAGVSALGAAASALHVPASTAPGSPSELDPG